MPAVAAIGALLTAAQTAPPDAQLPPIAKRAANPAEFVPKGWELEQQKVADLNGDGLPDALLMMMRPQPAGAPERILAVVLREPGQTAEYALSELNSRLIPRTGETQEDPMADGELIVRRGGFDIKLTLLAGIGSYATATFRYRFRYQDGCFRLIGYDRMETNRGTLDMRDLSINFLTGDVSHRTGNAQSAATKEQREKLKNNARRCFGELGSAATFNPL
jgi:hypothetical protein